jgi:hypothetical protein
MQLQIQIQLKFLSLLQNYIQRYFQIALGFFNSLFLKKNSISFLCLIALYSNANGIDQGQPNESAINYFIEFKPGIYNQPKDNNIDYLLTEINHLSTEQIKIKGISQSESDIATFNLALLRAETVKKRLVHQGIAPDRIIVSGEHKNFVMPNKIYHGAFITISENRYSEDDSIINNTEENKNVAFIEFPVGAYSKINPKQLERILGSLISLPNHSPLKLIGISQSKTNLATESLALQRARTVEDLLIASGIEAARIKLETEVTNNVIGNYLMHGVRILSTSNSPKDIQYESLDSVLEQLDSSNKNTPKITPSTEIIPQKALEQTPPDDYSQTSCTRLNIQKGSLKKNIQREITACGYRMGKWNFGTDEEYIDWIIPVAYKVNVDEGIFGILNIIEKNYQIRAHVHQLDRSIDFLPSINYERGQ